MPDTVLTAEGLGRRFGRRWALRHCDLALPEGRITALIGPNGAGKSTLMALAAGLLRPTEGTIRVLGTVPGPQGVPAGMSYLSQNKPLYPGLTVAETLRLGRKLNTDWDDEYATRLIDEAGLPSDARVRTLSGGQRTRVALTLALAKRPRLLVLDEPVADLDPLARRETIGALMAHAAEEGTTILVSSHIVSELADFCDHLMLLASGAVRVAGDLDELAESHWLLVGPTGDEPVPATAVVDRIVSPRETSLLVRGVRPEVSPQWQVTVPSIEDIVLGHLRSLTPVTHRTGEKAAT